MFPYLTLVERHCFSHLSSPRRSSWGSRLWFFGLLHCSHRGYQCFELRDLLAHLARVVDSGKNFVPGLPHLHGGRASRLDFFGRLSDGRCLDVLVSIGHPRRTNVLLLEGTLHAVNIEPIGLVGERACDDLFG